MTYAEFTNLVKADLYRYTGKLGWRGFLQNVLWRPGFKYTYLLRLCRVLHGRRLWFPVYIFARLLLRHYRFRYGIQIPFLTEIGPGLYIAHEGNIVVNSETEIGSNCNLNPNTIIGRLNRGKRKGNPTIGDSVFIGPNVNIIGNIHVGNYAAIGAGAVVTHDIPDYAVVVGVPAKVISYAGSNDYIERAFEMQSFDSNKPE